MNDNVAPAPSTASLLDANENLGDADWKPEALASGHQKMTPEATPELLLEMPDGPRFELLNGKLVERHMGAESSRVAARAISLLDQFVSPQRLGQVFATDCGYRIFEDEPNRVRFPDGSFIARGRLPGEKIPKGHLTLFPDLAVEVVSPSDLAEEVEGKRIDYLRAGTRLVWIIFPEARTIHVFRGDGSASVLTETDEITGGDVLPGFSCKVSQFFMID
jgi:Uma2 family endonuclease